MRQILFSQYRGDKAILHLHGVTEQELQGELNSLSSDVKVISGHFDFDVRRYIPRPTRVFTLLRDPVERLLSLYFYIGREKSHRWHELVRSGEMTLSDCAREQQNLQTRRLAGSVGDQPLPDSDLLRRAKHNLAEECAAFGLTERFDESIILFNRTLDWNVRGYTSDNVSRHRPARDKCSSKELDAICRCNVLDLELYAFAQDIFAQRVAAQPPAFQRDLARLGRRVRLYRGLASCTRALKTLISRSKT